LTGVHKRRRVKVYFVNFLVKVICLLNHLVQFGSFLTHQKTLIIVWAQNKFRHVFGSTI